MTLFGARKRRAKQRDDVDRLLANKALGERIGNEEGLFVHEIGVHFGMTGAEVMAAARSNPAIESFEDAAGRGMRLRYIGFRNITSDFRAVMDAIDMSPKVADAIKASRDADAGQLAANLKRAFRELDASPIRLDSRGRLIVRSWPERALRKLMRIFSL